MKTEISNYMRDMQRRSAAARWSGLSAEEKRAKMSALAKARWAKTKSKPKRVARRSNKRVPLTRTYLLAGLQNPNSGKTCQSRPCERNIFFEPKLHLHFGQ